jgi:hypothetical protein
MSVAGVLSGQFGQAGDGVAMDIDQASGLPDAAAFGEVVEDGTRFLVGEVGVEQRRPLALGEAVFAGLAVEQADLVVLAVAAADRKVRGVTVAGEGTIGILAAEACEVVHGVAAPVKRERVRIRGCE